MMPHDTDALITRAGDGERLSREEALALTGHRAIEPLLEAARAARERGRGNVVTFSPKVFIPLTRLCRDVCRYCTFARTPRRDGSDYLSVEQMIDIARAGAEAGCHEALFTLGDKPELRYRAARETLAALGHATTIEYLVEAARRVHEATGLLPHVNPGVMSAEDLAALRPVSVSAGLMLESVSPRLCERGGPHHGSPDKAPALRLDTLRLAGEQAVPFTTGILIGIGETRRERVESLLAIRDLHERYGHVQEVIVQNFRAKPDTPMAGAPEPSAEDHLWTIAVARLVLGPQMNLQAPPNLSAGALGRLLEAGINDWGGVSPVTPDHVNPEAPWPHLDVLERATEAGGGRLTPRLAVYPEYVAAPERWLDAGMRRAVLERCDARGYARDDEWVTGCSQTVPRRSQERLRGRARARPSRALRAVLHRARDGRALAEDEVARLLDTRGSDAAAVCEAADRLRADVNGEPVSYVVNRNINYTNVCYFRCQFCAFSKGRLSENLRGRPYDLDHEEIARRTAEAWARGATEVCLQGGIHPEYTGATYLRILHTVKAAAPGIHVHAFSPLEVWQGARTLEVSLEAYLRELRGAGLGSLPGTAAEILDDEVRAVLCPDKINTAQWLEVMATAHAAGLASTATIMFGHVDRPLHWARHLLRVRALQAETGGFTEFVPLPFVAAEAPIFLRGRARRGPTLREAVLMHAVARLALHPLVRNVQTSWVKMGPEGVRLCLAAGANDVGGTLMNESITRAAGAGHGQEMPPEHMEALVRALGREPRQRTTLYADAPAERCHAARGAPALAPVVETPARRYERRRRAGALVRPGLAS